MGRRGVMCSKGTGLQGAWKGSKSGQGTQRMPTRPCRLAAPPSLLLQGQQILPAKQSCCPTHLAEGVDAREARGTGEAGVAQLAHQPVAWIGQQGE